MAAAHLPALSLLSIQRPPSNCSLCLPGGRSSLRNYELWTSLAPEHPTGLPCSNPAVRLGPRQPCRQVSAKGVARRMLYDDSDSYVLIEPGQEEVFVNLEELQIRLQHWLEQWPGKELPSDLARYEAVEDAVEYLSTSACELDLGGGLGSVQCLRVAEDREFSDFQTGEPPVVLRGTMDKGWEAKMTGDPIKMFTPNYYLACAAGGMLSAGTTHFLITPLDVLKVNMQVDPVKYSSTRTGFVTIYREQGMTGLWKGWGGKLCGYGAQGALKFGFYEYFKKVYCDMAGPSNVEAYKTSIYMAGSASACLIADVALCPFEAVKVRVQTRPGYAKGLLDGFPKMWRAEGFPSFYKGLIPLWCRNLPFAMIMFSTFEHSVDLLYEKVVRKQRTDCSKGTQLGVTCAAGYVSGIMGSIVSNPADNIITHIYNSKSGVTSVAQAAKGIGLVGLFTRSLPLRMMIVGPIVACQWFAYDTLKVLFGLPTSGGIEHHMKADVSGE